MQLDLKMKKMYWLLDENVSVSVKLRFATLQRFQSKILRTIADANSSMILYDPRISWVKDLVPVDLMADIAVANFLPVSITLSGFQLPWRGDYVQRSARTS